MAFQCIGSKKSGGAPPWGGTGKRAPSAAGGAQAGRADELGLLSAAGGLAGCVSEKNDRSLVGQSRECANRHGGRPGQGIEEGSFRNESGLLLSHPIRARP